MPGLVGYVSNRPFDPGLLKAMAAPMMHRPNYEVKVHEGERFGVAAIDLPAGGQHGFAQSRDGRYVLVYYGMIYESWALTVGAGFKPTPTAEILLERWSAQGWKGVADLNGEYVVILWDRRAHCLTVINDRLGLKRFHYWHGSEMFAWSAEVKSLAVIPEVSRAIDEQALSELLMFGHLQGDRTLLRDVKLLPAASCLTWNGEKSQIKKYWDYVYQSDSSFENSDRAIGEYHDRLLNSVSKRLRDQERLGILLSGGLDSRTLAGLTREIAPDRSLRSWTSGHEHDHDSRFARKIAKIVGSYHEEVLIPENFLSEHAFEYVWILDGSVSADGSHRKTLRPAMQDQTDLLLNGYFGDVLAGSNLLERVAGIQNLEEVIQTGYQYYQLGFDESYLAALLRPAVYERIRRLAFQAFSEHLRTAHAENPADRLGVATLKRQVWSDAHAQLDLLDCDFHSTTPFTDREFIDFILKLPRSMRIGRKAYIEMIKKEYPRLARIPRAGDGLPLIRSRIRESLHWKWLSFYRHTLPKLTAGKYGAHPYSHYVHCEKWFRYSNAAFIKSVLINNPALEQHFQMDAISRFVLDFLNGHLNRDLSKALSALISFAVFSERMMRLPRAKTVSAALEVTAS